MGQLGVSVQRRERIYAFPTGSLGENAAAGQVGIDSYRECPAYQIFEIAAFIPARPTSRQGLAGVRGMAIRLSAPNHTTP